MFNIRKSTCYLVMCFALWLLDIFTHDSTTVLGPFPVVQHSGVQDLAFVFAAVDVDVDVDVDVVVLLLLLMLLLL